MSFAESNVSPTPFYGIILFEGNLQGFIIVIVKVMSAFVVPTNIPSNVSCS